MTAQHQRRPDDHLRCRSGRHVWLDDTARERCCDPAWCKILIAAQEWETPELTGSSTPGRPRSQASTMDGNAAATPLRDCW